RRSLSYLRILIANFGFCRRPCLDRSRLGDEAPGPDLDPEPDRGPEDVNALGRFRHIRHRRAHRRRRIRARLRRIRARAIREADPALIAVDEALRDAHDLMIVVESRRALVGVPVHPVPSGSLFGISLEM
ncbi:hypothetical protein BVRB_034250, partial [Beta vulgaris subsp. vulgaris]